MILKFSQGKVYDPANGVNGVVQDIYVRDNKIIDPSSIQSSESIKEYNLNGKILMAGAIDIHTHIGGGKGNIARLMLPEDHRDHPAHAEGICRSSSGHATPTTLLTGYRYAQMGYTACFEPAMLPANARHAHLEMADTPIIDTGGYVLLGNDELLLNMIANKADFSTICDFVAWTLDATQALGIKIVNPGGISAFKFNQRKLDIDNKTAHYEITPREIIRTLSHAIDALGVPHPVHIHTSNLGCANNYHSTIETVKAAEGHRLHLAHVQFHSYGNEGPYGFSSAAMQIAELINSNPNVTTDIGQIMFGQTVTLSGDSMHQYRNHHHASPNKWTIADIECEAGCGIVPFKYENKNFINALQWAIGLELFLTIADPWRVFLTTDHPNGAPFTSYPHLIRLLMDRSFRNDLLAEIHPDVIKATHLASCTREYSLYEIATMTRAAPARILGLSGKGHLGVGADADIVVYQPHDNVETMFAHPIYVFKGGTLVVDGGTILTIPPSVTHVVKPHYDHAIEKHVEKHYQQHRCVQYENAMISDDEMSELIGSPIVVEECQSP